jgi:hypothetical protein
VLLLLVPQPLALWALTSPQAQVIWPPQVLTWPPQVLWVPKLVLTWVQMLHWMPQPLMLVLNLLPPRWVAPKDNENI